ncbi:hypothetical protein OnM2_038058 [Erysiphe neolycopersici]|uniref:Uncharacterized protein n=1 Tax=Erysiphe neolycopersici TaxID=212602 RepID=A0A420HWN7_9PEZI|nr:hypothetical protein OnM2_038058 [Erysiphe neolycopersici]
MEPASRNFRGDIAFAERQKLNHVTRTVKTLSPQREDIVNRRTRQAIDPRWDPYSGEITSSDKGKPQSVKPKTFGISLRQVSGQKGNNGDLKTPTPVVERIRKLNSSTSFDTLEAKDSTYLTSSASTSVSNLEISAEESIKQAEHQSQPQSQTILATNDSDFTTKKAQLRNSESNKKASDISEDTRTRNITPNSVNKIYEVSGNKPNSAGTDHEKENGSGSSSDQVLIGSSKTENEILAKFHPSNGSNKNTQLLISESKFQKKHIQSPPPIKLENTDRTVQAHGPNNLSIITSIDVQKSSSLRSHNHELDKSFITSESLDQQKPLEINRVRPKETSSKLHQITRKAIPLGSPIFISMSIPPSTDAKDRHLLTKTLPQTPAENSSNDLVTALQAHLDNLAHRRRNITRSIRQMTELMPRDNLLITDEVRLKREHEKRKVALLREEEAEIKREEHEVGLRLHRAWKRTESGAVYEPTSLWVRRVTGVGKNWCWPHQDLPVC